MSLLKALVLVGGVITQLPAGDTVADWNTLVNKPSTFPPSTHSHAIADVTDLQTSLDAKANLSGATFSGAVNVNAAFAARAGTFMIDRTGEATTASIIVRRDAGQNLDINLQSGTLNRFLLRVTNTTESGGNAGSNFSMFSYDDSGVSLGTVYGINRNSRIFAFTLSPTAPTPTAGDNTTQVATTAFVTTAIGNAFAANDAMVFKGTINASTNPNYPAADAGHVYRISVAGKIGGASGPNVEIGDTIYCIVDGSAAGTHASVGANWVIVQSNLDGAVIGPASVTSGNPAVFNGTTGKLIQQVTFAEFKTSLALSFVDIAGVIADAQVSGSYTGIGSLTLSGSMNIAGIIQGTAATNFDIRLNTSDAADTKALRLSGGGGISTNTRGAYINLHGNEHATTPGDLRMSAGSTGGIYLLAATEIASNLNVTGTFNSDGAATFASNLTVGGGYIWINRVGDATATHFYLDGDESQSKNINFRTASVLRWNIQTNAEAEGGSNAGSNFVINRYSDAGSILAAALSINRATAAMTLSGALTVSNTITATSNISTDTAFVVEHPTGGLFGGASTVSLHIRPGTADGSDTAGAFLSGGGSAAVSRGGRLEAYGNEHSTQAGDVRAVPGTGGVFDVIGTMVASVDVQVTGKFGGFLWGTKTFDWPSIINQASSTTTITVTGAAVGDVCLATHSTWATGMLLEARVTSANTVTIYLTNQTGSTQDLASGTLSVMVFKQP